MYEITLTKASLAFFLRIIVIKNTELFKVHVFHTKTCIYGLHTKPNMFSNFNASVIKY